MPACGRSSKERKIRKQNFYWKTGGSDSNTEMMVSVCEAVADRDQERQLRILVVPFLHCVTLGTSLNLSVP